MSDGKQYCDGNGYCLKGFSTQSTTQKADNDALVERDKERDALVAWLRNRADDLPVLDGATAADIQRAGFAKEIISVFADAIAANQHRAALQANTDGETGRDYDHADCPGCRICDKGYFG